LVKPLHIIDSNEQRPGDTHVGQQGADGCGKRAEIRRHGIWLRSQQRDLQRSSLGQRQRHERLAWDRVEQVG
jgi:hypothetical protein